MSGLRLVVFFLATFQIQGFDLGRKSRQDTAKSDNAETEVRDLKSNMAGRRQPLLANKLPDLDNAIDSRLTKYIPDVADRGMPLLDDADESYLTKTILDFVDRGLPLLDNEQQEFYDAGKRGFTNDILDHADRGVPLLDDKQQELHGADESYLTKDIASRGVPLSLLRDITTKLDNIMTKQDDMQAQIEELQEDKKLVLEEVQKIKLELSEKLSEEVKKVKLEVSEKCQIGTRIQVVPYSDSLIGDGKSAIARSKPITFDPSFSSPPSVMLSLDLLDSYHNQNLRVGLAVRNITTTSAEIKVTTWNYTKLYGARVSWIACPK